MKMQQKMDGKAVQEKIIEKFKNNSFAKSN